MNDTVLQIPLSKNLKNEATQVSREYGFSSLQELVRVFLRKLAKKEAVVTIETVSTKLSSASEKKYQKISRDFDNKKNSFQAENVDNLVSQLIDGH